MSRSTSKTRPPSSISADTTTLGLRKKIRSHCGQTLSWSRTRSPVAAQPPPSRNDDGCRHELDGIANEERVEPEVEHFRRRNEMGEPEQPEEVDRNLAGDHRHNGSRQIFRPT